MRAVARKASEMNVISAADAARPSRLLPTRLSRTQVLLLLAGAAVWLAFSIPAVSLSRWFPMDMPALFLMGAHLDEWLAWILSPFNGSGRYFPAYWLYWCLQFPLFGDKVWAYLLVLNLLFLGATALTSAVLYRATRNVTATLLLFVAIYLSSPLAENLATIGKAEALSYLLLIAVVASFQRGAVRAKASLFTLLGLPLVFTLSIWTKETSLVMAGFAVVGAVTAYGMGKVGASRGLAPPVRPWLGLLGILAVGVLVSRLPYWIFPRTRTSTDYVDYKITADLLGDNLYFYLTQQPDVIITGLLATILLLLAARKLWTRRLLMTADDVHQFVLMVAICAMGWGYWLALQVWRWPMAYYMLLPAITFKASAVYAIWLHLRNGDWNAAKRGAVFGLVGVCLAYGGLAMYYITASQIAYSRLYTDALYRVRDNLGPKQRLVIETYPFFAEQIQGTESLLEEQLGRTVKVGGIGELIDPAMLKPDLMKLLRITPQDLERNLGNVPKRGDLMLTFTGSKLGTWFLRGVTPFYMPDSFLKREGSYDMELVATRDIVTFSPFIHVWDDRPTAGSTWLGYKLYRIKDEKPKFLWSGRYPDGWIGEKATVTVNPNYRERLSFVVSAPPYVLPATVMVRRDGQLMKSVELKTTEEMPLDLGPAPATSTAITFEVSKTFVGRDIRLNRDDRKLGARIALVPPAVAASKARP